MQKTSSFVLGLSSGTRKHWRVERNIRPCGRQCGETSRSNTTCIARRQAPDLGARAALLGRAHVSTQGMRFVCRSSTGLSRAGTRPVFRIRYRRRICQGYLGHYRGAIVVFVTSSYPLARVQADESHTTLTHADRLPNLLTYEPKIPVVVNG